MSISVENIEGRKESRHRTFISGRIICPKTSTTYNCQVLDLSDGGARLSIEQWYSFPKHIVIEIGHQDLIEGRYEVEIRWTDARHIGVQILRELENGESLLLHRHTLH